MSIHFFRSLLLTLLLLLVGCSSEKTKFYVLNSMHVPARHAALGRCGTKIALGPVTIPQYLDRPQIVTRLSMNQISLSEFHRWAEPLKNNIVHVLRQNLQQLLPAAVIYDYPVKSNMNVSYRVVINIIDYDANHLGISRLKVDWQVVDYPGTHIYYRQRSTYYTHVNVKDYKSIVNGMDANLNKLSRRIVRVLRHRLRIRCKAI